MLKKLRISWQADLDDPRLKEKFQQLFDKTMKAGFLSQPFWDEA